MPDHPISLDDIRGMDRNDPLPELRGRFSLPPDTTYFDGHSLGPPPTAALARTREVAEREWGERLIRSWNECGWIEAPQRVGAKIARLIGAKPHEVIVADSTSVNIFKLLTAAAGLSGRGTILSEEGSFHTDVYIAGGVAELLGLSLRLVPRADLRASIGSDTNLLLLTQVHYKTAERFDMAALTAIAREAGALTVWDLSHSVGAIPLELNRDGVELAVGCGYKYLNGGPGAPAFLYVAEHLQDRLLSPLRGWMGHASPFDFTDDYLPAPGMNRFLAGTPPILSLAALETGIDAFEGISMEAVWTKSIRLFDLFRRLTAERCPMLACISPSEPSERGSHIAFRHPQAFEICQALIEVGVIGDFRAADVIRFGLTPLYLRYEDVWTAVERCADVVDNRRWNHPKFAIRHKVT